MRLISSTNLYTSGTGRQDRGEHGHFRKYMYILSLLVSTSLYVYILSPYSTAMEISLLIPVASGKCTHIHVHDQILYKSCICKGRQDKARHSPKADSEKKH